MTVEEEDTIQVFKEDEYAEEVIGANYDPHQVKPKPPVVANPEVPSRPSLDSTSSSWVAIALLTGFTIVMYYLINNKSSKKRQASPDEQIPMRTDDERERLRQQRLAALEASSASTADGSTSVAANTPAEKKSTPVTNRFPMDQQTQPHISEEASAAVSSAEISPVVAVTPSATDTEQERLRRRRLEALQGLSALNVPDCGGAKSANSVSSDYATPEKKHENTGSTSEATRSNASPIDSAAVAARSLPAPTTVDSDISTEKVTTKKKVTVEPPPPIQIFCYTLSELLQAPVTVEQHLDAGTWGGRNWKKAKTPPRKQPPLKLTLHPYYFAMSSQSADGSGTCHGLDQSWDALESALQKVFLPDKADTNDGTAAAWSVALGTQAPKTPLSPASPDHDDVTWLRTIVRLYNRFSELIRNGSYPPIVKLWLEGSGDTDRNAMMALNPCLSVIRTWLIQQVTCYLRTALLAAPSDGGYLCGEGPHDDEDIPDIFLDDYGAQGAGSSAPASAPYNYSRVASELDVLPLVLESGVTGSFNQAELVSTEFIEDLFDKQEAAGGRAGASQTGQSLLVSPAGILFCYCLHRVDQVLHSARNFQESVLSNRLLVISTLLSISPSVRTVVGDIFRTEQQQDYQKISNSRLRPVFEAVGYVVPAVGSDEPPQARQQQRGNTRHLPTEKQEPLFQQLNSTSKSFPINVFKTRSSGRDEVGQVLHEAVALMRVARATAQSLLRVAFKSIDKNEVFSWLGAVLRRQ
jgi:hypothetical protein